MPTNKNIDYSKTFALLGVRGQTTESPQLDITLQFLRLHQLDSVFIMWELMVPTPVCLTSPVDCFPSFLCVPEHMCSSRQPPVTLDPQLVFGGRELSSLVMAQPLLGISEDVEGFCPTPRHRAFCVCHSYSSLLGWPRNCAQGAASVLPLRQCADAWTLRTTNYCCFPKGF